MDNEETARMGFWEAVRLLQQWINEGPDSTEEVLEELEEELDK